MNIFSQDTITNTQDFDFGVLGPDKEIDKTDYFFKEQGISLKIFSSNLCILETVVIQMRKNYGFSFPFIAKVLNRAVSTITTTYARAVKKTQKENNFSSFSKIPFSVFAYRKLSVFESVVMYLKYVKRFDYKTISGILQRTPDVVWRVHKNATSKITAQDYVNEIGKEVLLEMNFFSKHSIKFKSRSKTGHTPDEALTFPKICNKKAKKEVESTQ
ncbi:MAG: hypothetical protein ACOCQG_05880 [Candidatus Nanoarchaeia archaeon]